MRKHTHFSMNVGGAEWAMSFECAALAVCSMDYYSDLQNPQLPFSCQIGILTLIQAGVL